MALVSYTTCVCVQLLSMLQGSSCMNFYSLCRQKVKETQVIADDGEKDLDQALPALQAANKVSSLWLHHQ